VSTLLEQAIGAPVVDLEEISLDSVTRPGRPPEIEHPPAQPRLGSDFVKLWGATAASNLSDGIRVAALPLLAASMTRDPLLVGGVFFVSQAPWLLFGLVSGAIVDRFPRRQILLTAHLFRMLVVAVLMVAVIAGAGGILPLFVAAFLLGSAETMFDNATQVMVPEVVDSALLERANARQTMAVLGGQQLAGPVVGAALFAVAATAPFVVDVVALALAALCIFSMKHRPAAPEKPQAPMRREIRDGVAWLWAHPTLRRISLAAAAVNMAITAHIAIFVLFALEVLGTNEVGFGLILGCYAAGGIAGGFAAPALIRFMGTERSMLASVAVAAVTVLLTGLTSSALVVGILQVGLAVAGSTWAVVTCTLRQRLTPSRMLGRITGAHQLLSWGGAAVGAGLGGIIGSTLGLRAPFLLGAVVLAVAAVLLGRGLREAARTTADVAG
jgi:MFS family permease